MAKLMKVWSISGVRKAVMASTLEELKRKGSVKLNSKCAPEGLTAFLEDGTEVDDEEIFEALPEGTIIYLCQEGENPLELNVVLNVQASFSTVPELENNESQPQDGYLEEIDPCSSLKKAWPKGEFPISFHRFSQNLTSRLNEGISAMTWSTRHELLSIIAEDISVFTLHPDIAQRKQVAQCLLKKFPALESQLNDSLSGWAQRIYDKMKDVRRTLASPEASFVRKVKRDGSRKMPIRAAEERTRRLT